MNASGRIFGALALLAATAIGAFVDPDGDRIMLRTQFRTMVQFAIVN